MTDVVKVDPFDNVVATGLATTKYRPIGPSALFGFVLILGGTFTEANITSIRVKAPGGKDLIPSISGARLRDLIEYEGLINDATHLPILFGDPTAQTLRGKHLGNFDHTVYPGDMTIEVDIAGAIAPTLEARALITAPKILLGLDFTPAEAAQHRALIETVLTISAAVNNQSQQIGVGSAAGSQIKKVLFFHGGNMTQLDVKKEGLNIYEEVDAALNDYLQDDLWGARLPQANLFVYDRLVDTSYGQAGTTIKRSGVPFNWQFRVSTSAADTVTVFADLISAVPLL